MEDEEIYFTNLRAMVDGIHKATTEATVAAHIAVADATRLQEVDMCATDGEPYPVDIDDTLQHLEAAALSLRAAGHIAATMKRDCDA